MMAFTTSCRLHCPTQAELDWVLSHGVLPLSLVHPMTMRVAIGGISSDGRFDLVLGGERWFAFEEPDADDIVFWHGRSGRLATWSGRAFALGEIVIDQASTYSFDCALTVFDNPMDWLRARRDGIVVLPGHWPLAFDRLREVPRVAIAETLLPLYRRHMRPARLPDVSIFRAASRLAA